MTVVDDAREQTPVMEFDALAQMWCSTVTDRLAAFDLRPGPMRAGTTAVEAHDLGDLLITDWRCPAVEGRRSPSMAGDEPDSILLITAFAGTQVIETPKDSLVLRPGELLIVGSHLAARLTVPAPTRKRTVRIPRTALQPFVLRDQVPGHVLLSTGASPLASLTTSYLNEVTHTVDEMSPREVEVARTALLSLVAGMIRTGQAAEVGETDFLPILRQQLEQWIVDHLASGAVRVSDIAKAHNVAPRTVQRAFARSGQTFGSVVRKHRIDAARNDLVTTHLPVAAIAYRWGFCDTSHLGREFRREFSMSPSDYRDLHCAAQLASASGD